jgi:hypothetical protein
LAQKVKDDLELQTLKRIRKEERDLRKIGRTRKDFELAPEEVQELESLAGATNWISVLAAIELIKDRLCVNDAREQKLWEDARKSREVWYTNKGKIYPAPGEPDPHPRFDEFVCKSHLEDWLKREHGQELKHGQKSEHAQQAPQPAEPPRRLKASQRLPKREVDNEELLAATRVRYAVGDHPNVNVVANDVQDRLGVHALRHRIRTLAKRSEFDGLRGERGVKKRR